MLRLTTECRQEWLFAISRADLNMESKNVVVCERHFKKGNYSSIHFYVSFIIVFNYEFSGKPADTMYTFDVDWRPCLLLGHNRIDIKALEAAQEKYERTKARRQRMDEANSVASAETSTQCDDPNSKEVQTDTKTFCDAETQTEDDDFFF